MKKVIENILMVVGAFTVGYFATYYLVILIF